MTTTGLAEKYKLSQSSVRRIIREDREKDDKKRVKMVLPNVDVDSFANTTIPDIVFKKAAEPIKLEGFSLGYKDKSQDNDANSKVDVEIEKITSDEQEDTDDFIKTFVDDANREEDDADQEEYEHDDDEQGLDPPAMFGATSNNARLNKLADLEMERQALEAGDAIDRLLGEDATEAFGSGGANANKQSKGRPFGAAVAVEEAKRIEDEAEQRSKYLSRIYLNVINFSDHLPFIKNQEKFLTSLHRKSTKELIALCQMIETQRSLGNVANQMKHSYFMVCRGAELLSQKYAKMKTQGFTDEMLKKERELNMIFQEIAIESADTLRAYTTPTMRLAMLTASTLMAVDNNNRVRDFKEQVEAKAVNPEISQQYGDL